MIKKTGLHYIKLNLSRYWQLYIILLIPTVFLVLFQYVPMYGLQIAFREFNPIDGFYGGKWVGLENFRRFFNAYSFWEIIWNTLSLSVYSLVAGFPIPIILAISINEIRNRHFRKTVQMVTYAPHFISVVVLVAMVQQVLSPHLGVVNHIIKAMGYRSINFMGLPQYFQSIYVWSGIWQGMGYSSIIYIATLSAVDLQLYEAVFVDGASRLQKIWYIDLPCLLPTAIVMLILNMGRIMSVGFEKVYLMQNGMNMQTSEVIATYVYKVGLILSDFSFSTAVGFFNSVINLLFIVVFNQLVRRVSNENSLW